MPDVLYVPILKGRQGELAALGMIQPMTRQRVLPVLEIMPPTDEAYAAAPLRSAIEKTARKLKVWAGQRLLLDGGLLTAEVELRDGIGAVGFSVAAATDQGVEVTPVVHLNDGPLARRDAANWHADTRRGVAVRLTAEELDEDSENIDEALTELLQALAVDRRDADLILDLGPVVGDLMVRAHSRLAADVLRELSGAQEWREVIVSSGAFPADLSAYPAWALGEPVRYDAALYDQLRQRRRIPRQPVFSDYAVTHPILTGLGYRSSPHLRYTVADRWLVLKGRLNDPRGHAQFYDVCETIAAHPDFVGSTLGRADARIADPRGVGPGNASTWREVGTTHHIDYVVKRITTLGEP
jgi:hypothetical protein